MIKILHYKIPSIKLLVFSKNYKTMTQVFTDTDMMRDVMKPGTRRHKGKNAKEDQWTPGLSNHCWQEKGGWKKLLLLSPDLVTVSRGALALVHKDEPNHARLILASQVSTLVNNTLLFWNSYIPSDLLKQHLLQIHCSKMSRELIIQPFLLLRDIRLSPSFNTISQHKLKKSPWKTHTI